MSFNLARLVLVSSLAAVACAGAGGQRPGGAGGSSSDPGGSGGSDEPTGGSAGRGGSAGSGGRAGAGGSTPDAGEAAGTGGAGPAADARTEAEDASAPGGKGGGGDAASDGPGKTTADAGPINLEGAIPPYEGPPVPPEVKMDCPGDPTAGFVEYKDTFKVEHPYDLPVSARFSIDGGIYTFWVMQGDKRHNPTSTASNPRTEARYSQNFRTGIRMWSADVYWERSVTHGTVVMQVHTTATGIGPVYLVANGDSVPPISGSKVPGGLFDRWINLKVLINADSTASQYWVNNCLVASKGSGTRGDGNDYFKMGVYHCDSGTCRDRYKNVHLYMKQ
jgi:hypothetical protein